MCDVTVETKCHDFEPRKRKRYKHD